MSPTPNLFQRIEETQGELSSGQREIARFLVNHYATAAFLSAADLGERVGVSESTVVRFAMRLDYDGYPELKRDLQGILKSKLTTVDRVHGTADTGKAELLPYRLIRADMENLAMVLDELDLTTFRRAVGALISGLNVYVIAARSALAVGTFLSYNLGWIRPRVELITPALGGHMLERLVGVGQSDVAIAITIPRYTRTTVKGLEYAKSRGCTTIAITDSSVSPLATHADIALYTGTQVESFADSFVAPLSVANALLASISVETKDTSTHRLRELEELWSKEHIYLKE